MREIERERRMLLHAISHDVRAPLRAMEGFARALEEDHAGSLDGTALDYLRRVRNGALRMDRMIDGLVRLARLDDRSPARERTDISHCARDIRSGLLESFPAHAVAFTIEPGMEIVSDRALVRLILDEFLSNAWKFTHGVAAPAVAVTRVPSPEGTFAFAVGDNGAGFDAASAGERLFGLFQRFHAPDRFSGEGVGLALASRAALLLGGTLSVASAPGAGATFTCTLPQPTRS